MSPFVNVLRAASGISVLGTSDGGEATGTTSHSVTLPASVAVGDVLVLMFRLGTDTVATTPENTVTLPAGWTLVTAEAGIVRVARRTHQSGDPTTVTVTTSKSLRSAWQVYRFGGAHGDVESSGDAVAPGHLAITPTWGSAENAFIAMVSGRWTSQTFVEPASYVDKVYASNVARGSSSTDNCHLVTAHRILTATSETPGDWTITGTPSQEYTLTLAVRPA